MSRRPNIIIANCHDLGRHLHCYGVEGVVSPNLDRFAGQGARFTHAFCTAPQCSPSRASLFTGRYPHANGVMGLCHGRHAWDLHDGERHLASLLRDAGYDTALIGVQHETRRPERMGYAEYDPARRGHADEVARFASDYLQRRSGGDKPFFLQIGFTEPHRTLYGYSAAPESSRGVTVPPYLCDEYSAHEDLAYFQGAIRDLDAAWGSVCETIDRAGLADNTLVVFTTDHGIPYPRAKCAVYDPGLEIAQIIRWPGEVQPGRLIEPLVSNVDVLPTVLDIVGAAVPANVQGVSFASLLRGGVTPTRAEIFGEMTYHDYCDPRRCIRTATHKLIANFTTAPFFMDPSQQWRPRTITVHPPDPKRHPHEPVELYDLRADPLERDNLAGRPEHDATRRELLGRLHRWMRDTGDPLLEGIPVSPMYRNAMAALRTGDLTPL